jgi:hypothetical protein
VATPFEIELKNAAARFSPRRRECGQKSGRWDIVYLRSGASRALDSAAIVSSRAVTAPTIAGDGGLETTAASADGVAGIGFRM